MKTVAKMSMTALLSVLWAGCIAGGTVAAYAQTADLSPVIIDGGASSSQAAPPGPVTKAAAIPPSGEKSGKEVLDAVKAPAVVPESKKDEIADKKAPSSAHSKKSEQEDKDDEDEQESEFPKVTAKMPDSVNTVVKRLNTATEGVTLDDLNSAREAIAKLDVLIDIEKRLSDLAEIRKEREEKVGLLEGAIPESALKGNKGFQSPPAITPELGMGQALPAGMIQPAPAPVLLPLGGGEPEVVRISGTNANYTAQVKDSSGTVKRVQIGDKLSDGSVVTAISLKGITYTLPDHKTTKTAQVKDIGVVVKGRSGGI